ncbi:hypothetical protein SDRG_10131 [Saprolegnia diclina VS20]|uniref:WW domain-containing protein n=1 Tax=Saprolegnia diclina (strain VS20) TaxID=1156394 RepID=T0QCG2_SAPDV|nr:hypothetical protein SDRG_10131 [Saprolegnia diclina VS20]EQC32386.1 hypothetical protein SDRG_10131 [Saprolegnia diclina VS20]|eukprot:XP_008614327.1 hypothetical protein SDRG_10131 [Saprolegnia diclina VS20]
MKRPRPDASMTEFARAHPEVEYALQLHASHRRAKAKLPSAKKTETNQANERTLRLANDSVHVSFPKAPRFRGRLPDAIPRPVGSAKRQRSQIHAGIYVLRNTRTGHAFFGSTWDLENAKSQNYQDLLDGKHVNRAMVRSMRAYGDRDIAFQILQTIPTGKEIQFRELEDALSQRLQFYVARAQRTHARRLFRRWQHAYWSYALPVWSAFVKARQSTEAMAAALELQRLWRGRRGRRAAHARRRFVAARRLQGVVRVFLSRRVLLHLRQDRAARTLQHTAKGFVYWAKFKRYRRSTAAAATLQRVWRGHAGRRRAHAARLHEKKTLAAHVLQRSLRRFAASCFWAARRLQQRETAAAIQLQRRWRGVYGRRRAAFYSDKREQVRRLHRAAATIQTAYYAYHIKKFQFAARSLLQQKRTAQRLSVYWRNFVARKFGWAALQIHLEHKTATHLQRWLVSASNRRRIRRGCLHCKLTRRAIVLQRYARGYIARHVLLPAAKRRVALTHAANYIGRWYRSLKWARLVTFVFRTRAATTIQATFRSFCVYRRFQASKVEWRETRAAVKIQCQFRIHRAKVHFRQRIYVLRAGACAECRNVLAKLYSIPLGLELCESCYTMILDVTDLARDADLPIPIELYRHQRAMATRIAAAYKGYAARLLRRSLVCDMCATRAEARICLECPRTACHSCMATVHALPYNAQHVGWRFADHARRTAAATALQARARCFLQRGTLQARRDAKRSAAATILQGWWRARYSRHLARLLQAKKVAHDALRTAAARTLQRVYRGMHGRRRVARRRQHIADQARFDEAVITVQAHMRGALARRCVNAERAQRQVIRQAGAALAIQCAFRQHVARLQCSQRRRFLAARRIQSMVRVYLAKGVLLALQLEYERNVQLAIEHVKHRRMVRRVTRIQALYRQRRDFRRAVAARLGRARDARCHWERVCQFVETRNARLLQRAYRRRYALLSRMATRLQGLVRRHFARRDAAILDAKTQSLRRETAAITLQCFGRSIMANRTVAALRLAAAARAQDEWVECVDETSGYTYYYNTVTAETRWDCPTEMPLLTDSNNDSAPVEKVGTGSKGDGDPATGDWVECWDETHSAFYYVHSVTGETSWEAPATSETAYDWYYDENGQVVYYTPATDDNQTTAH